MKRKQSGLSLVGFLVVLAVVGFAAYVGMKLFPMYQEYYSVQSAMKGLANEPGVADMDPAKVQDLLFRRLYIYYSENVKPQHVKFERMEAFGRALPRIRARVQRDLAPASNRRPATLPRTLVLTPPVAPYQAAAMPSASRFV